MRKILQVCREWNTAGGCTYGTSCRKKHLCNARGSAASLRGTGASSTDEQEGKEDKGEGDLDRELKVLDQGRTWGRG